MSLRLIFPIVWLIAMISLASQGDRIGYIGITENEKRRIEEADIARQVQLINERDRNRKLKSHHPYPRAHRLDDGIHGDKSIKELMDGFRGLL